MGQIVTLADLYTLYSKPSLEGRLVIRKRRTHQVSDRLRKRKEWVREKTPADEAHDACVEAGKSIKKRLYIPGKGYEEVDVCPIQEFRKFLRVEMTPKAK